MSAESVKENYDNGECPDCGQAIPENAVFEEDCTNCGHVFNAPGQTS